MSDNRCPEDRRQGDVVKGKDFTLTHYRVKTDQLYVTMTAYLSGGIEVSAKTSTTDIDYYEMSSLTGVIDELVQRLSFVVSLINQTAEEVAS